MSKHKAIFFLGVWLAILPFLGFPVTWKRILALISGLAVAYLAYLLNKNRPRAMDRQGAFVENKHEGQQVAQ